MNNIFYLTYRDKLLLFVSLLFSTLSFSQLKIDEEKHKNFYALKNEYEFSVNFSNKIGEKMIAFAQDDYEKSMAYVILGENYYNKSDFLNAVLTDKKLKKR